MLYHELLKPSEMVTVVRYQQQLIKLHQALKKKGPEYAKLILLHDNARPHVAELVNKIYTGHELGSLASSTIFT